MIGITTERTKVRMLSAIASMPLPKHGFPCAFDFAEGDVVDLDPQLAKAWIIAGSAEAVKEEKKAAK